MASAITRTSMTDDDGTGTTGTVFNNAWKTSVYDQIDQMFAGSGSYATFTFGGSLAVASTLAVSGFGTHTFSAGGTGNQALLVTNTSSGTTMAALVRATAGTSTGQLVAYSQGYTTGTYDVQAGAAVVAAGAGGLSLAATDAVGEVRFYTGGSAMRTKIDFNGDYVPATDNTQKVGVALKAFTQMCSYAFTNVSDVRKKRGIDACDLATDFLRQLRPVRYAYSHDDEARTRYGFLAHEVAPLVGADCGEVSYEDGIPVALNYQGFIAPLVAAVQEIDRRIAQLETR
jgi:hypothetical protein